MAVIQRQFDSALSLAQNLSRSVASSLRQAIAAKGKATLAVSGGTTPILFFELLSQANLPWNNVIITLVDERQVPETSPRSNAKLVKEHLLQNQAAAAQFVSLYQNESASNCPDFDVCILGMGNDGHTASFFPGGDTLVQCLSAQAPAICAIIAPGAGEPRLTFTLPKILAATEIILHIQGAGKITTLAKAQTAGPIEDMPVRAILRSAKLVQLYACL